MIIMGVVIVLLIYMYFFYNTRETVITQKLDLSVQAPSIEVAKITDPGAVRYAYECWIYVNQYNGNNKQLLFYRDSGETNGGCTAGNAASGQTPASTATFPNAVSVNNIGVYISGTSPTLNVEYVKNNDAVQGIPINVCTNARQANEKGTIIVTDNFPVQTWVHLIVSVDNAYIDTYVNGKLTKSILEQDGILAPSSTAPMAFGVAAGTSLAKFTRYTTPIDPQTAWDKYSAGNGSNKLAKYLGTLGMDVSLKKDNIEYSKLNIF